MLKNLIPKLGIAQGSAGNGVALGAGGATLNAPGNVATGWNVFHATNCEWFTDGTNNFLFVLPSEGGFWVIANNIYAADTFKTGCVNGNFEAVFVVNGTTGAFTNILTFAFK